MKAPKAEDYLRPAEPTFEIEIHCRWSPVLLTMSSACILIILKDAQVASIVGTVVFLVASILTFIFSLIHAIQDYRRSHKAADLLIMCVALIVGIIIGVVLA